MGKAEFYIKVIGQCVIKTKDGLTFNRSLAKDQFALEIATTCIENLIKNGELSEIEFNTMLTSHAKDEVVCQ